MELKYSNLLANEEERNQLYLTLLSSEPTDELLTTAALAAAQIEIEAQLALKELHKNEVVSGFGISNYNIPGVSETEHKAAMAENIIKSIITTKFGHTITAKYENLFLETREKLWDYVRKNINNNEKENTKVPVR